MGAYNQRLRFQFFKMHFIVTIKRRDTRSVFVLMHVNIRFYRCQCFMSKGGSPTAVSWIMNEPLQICNGEHHESNNFLDECIIQHKRNTAQHGSFSISRNKNHYRHLDFALTLASFKTNIHTLILNSTDLHHQDQIDQLNKIWIAYPILSRCC